MATNRISRKPVSLSASKTFSSHVSDANETIDDLNNNSQGQVVIKEEPRSQYESHWRPSLAHSPIMGIGALILVLACTAGCIVVLISSNGKPLKAWKVQPTVLLALFSAIANTALAFALTQGVALSWWNRALKGSTVRELHQHWKFGTSIWACLTNLKWFNYVALANLMVTLVVVDGPLWQRSSTVTSHPVNGTISIEAMIAPEIPTGYTGYISGRDEYPDRLTPSFIPVTQGYINRAPINSGFKGCVGTCTVDVPAAGLASSCSTTESPIDYNPILNNDSTYNSASFDSYPAFSVNVEWGSGGIVKNDSMSVIDVIISYAKTTSCSGVIITNTCRLTSAVLLYHVLLQGNTATLVPPLTNLTVLALANNTNEIETFQSYSTLGGIAIAGNDLFYTNATIRFNGVGGFQPFGLSTFASGYIGNGTLLRDCQYNWVDPTNDILAALNNIMFRTALHVASASDYAPSDMEDNFPIKFAVQGTVDGVQNVFKTDYAFVGAAVVVIVLGILTVVPTFYQFWLLGRPVTFSPIETAKAFNSPLLGDPHIASVSSDVETLVKRVGRRRVRYGAVNVDRSGRPLGSGDSNASPGEFLMVLED